MGIQYDLLSDGQSGVQLSFPANPAANTSWLLEYGTNDWSTLGVLRVPSPTTIGLAYSGDVHSRMSYRPEGNRALVTVYCPLNSLPGGDLPVRLFRLHIISN